MLSSTGIEGRGRGVLPSGPEGADDSSRWEAANIVSGAPTGQTVIENPAPRRGA
jgi:hypothetical protein